MEDLFVFGGIFLVSLLVRIWFNFVDSHINNYASCDAYEYIDNAYRLLNLQTLPNSIWSQCLACLSGSASVATWETVRSALAPLKDFHISGPVFPVYLALSLIVTGGTKLSSWYAWNNLVAVQSIFSALTALFIGLITRDAFDRRAAVVAGLIAAFYPGFIVNSGRLYSETFACFLLVVVCYLTNRGFRAGGNSLPVVFFGGILAASLQLTRSIMALLTAALFVLSAFQQSGWKRKLVAAAAFLLGFAVVASPWIVFQKLAFGDAGLIVDRVGHYNFFIGNNIETSGWLSYPYPDGSGIENKSFATLLQEAAQKSPERWLKLMLDKPERLFKFPWNDFKTAIGPITHNWQVLAHQLLLLMAAIGVCIGFVVTSQGTIQKEQLRSRVFLSGLFLFHFIYFLFITVPRYNLTSVPELIVFAAAGITALAGLFEQKTKTRYGLILTLSAAAFFVASLANFLPLYMAVPGMTVRVALVLQCVSRAAALLTFISTLFWCVSNLQGSRLFARSITVFLGLSLLPVIVLPNRANGRWYEWSGELSSACKPVTMQLRLPLSEAGRISGRKLVLMVDLESRGQFADGLKVEINGKQLPKPVIPGMSLVEGFESLSGGKYLQREGERMWDSLAVSAGLSNLDFRQWAMIEIPAILVDGALEKARVDHHNYANFDVALTATTLEKIRLFGSYDCGSAQMLIPSVNLYSWEKAFYGVEESRGLNDTRYDLKVPAAHAVTQDQDLSSDFGKQNGYWNMRLLLAPPVVNQAEAPISPLRYSVPSGVVSTPSTNAVIRDFSLPAIKNRESMLFVRMRGKVHRLTGNTGAELEVLGRYRDDSGKTGYYLSSWIPKRLKMSSAWTDFDFAFPIKPCLEHQLLDQIRVQFRTADPLSGCWNTERKYAGQVELDKLTLELEEQSANPIGLGHIVY